MVADFNSMDVRPYQLMCMICRPGDQQGAAYPFAKRLDGIVKAIHADPARPVTLRCNVDTVYEYQNPGREYDTPEGDLFNDRRDLAILQRLGLVPGATRPAIDLVSRVFKAIRTVDGICGFQRETPECSLAKTGNYARGIEKGMDAIIPPWEARQKHRAKCSSTKAIYEAETLHIRPHHLLCMACFYNGGRDLKPISEDNLYEVIDVVQKHPGIPVTLVKGPCMICPPCSRYCPKTNKCIGGNSMGLRDQKKDLDTLQVLGLTYGDTLPAAKLFRLLFARTHSTTEICGNGTGVRTAPEWNVCGGPRGNPGYVRSRERNMDIGRPAE